LSEAPWEMSLTIAQARNVPRPYVWNDTRVERVRCALKSLPPSHSRPSGSELVFLNFGKTKELMVDFRKTREGGARPHLRRRIPRSRE